LKLVTDGCNYKKQERLAQLQNVVDCELTGLSVSHNPKVNKETMQGGIMFRTKSQRLCGQDFCHYPINVETCHSCHNIDLAKASDVCSQLIPAAKVIRFCELELLDQFLNKNKNVKVPVVIRDPRSIYASRKVHYKGKLSNFDLVKNVKWTCLNMIKILERNTTSTVKIFKYETFTDDFLTSGEDFYDFLGLGKLDPSVVGYRKSNRAKLWKKDITFMEIQSIQSEPYCLKVLELAKYQVVRNVEDIKYL